jgi:putative endonuclease
MTWWRKKKNDLGCWGEEVAKKYLKSNGYKILAEHWTSRIGELDIVAYKSGFYIFVEVKTRSSQKFGPPEEAVTWWKREKLRKTAELFLLKNNLFNASWQIDVIAINYNPLSKKIKINHLENVVES